MQDREAELGVEFLLVGPTQMRNGPPAGGTCCALVTGTRNGTRCSGAIRCPSDRYAVRVVVRLGGQVGWVYVGVALGLSLRVSGGLLRHLERSGRRKSGYRNR